MRDTTRELLEGTATVVSTVISVARPRAAAAQHRLLDLQTGLLRAVPGRGGRGGAARKRVVERHYIDRVEPPELTSAWSDAEANADPQGWAEALLADLGAWVNAFFDIDGRVAASNAVGAP
jgi:hypothetical protein